MSQAGLAPWLERAWYDTTSRRTLWLRPLSWLFRRLASARRRQQQADAVRLPVPVIVVGNITVGGTGKTPLILALAKHLQARGWQPGIISRGYGGRLESYPALVPPDGDPARYGDEPVLLARNSHCPVAVDPDRVRAAQFLLGTPAGCNLILSDDGLQHYRLARDIEIIVVDGRRLFGNGQCLPEGPLREPPSRLAEATFVVSNGSPARPLPVPTLTMQVLPQSWLQVRSGLRRALAEGTPAGRVHAVAGIGNPQRFFDTLRALGLDVIEHAFADHHAFTASDLDFGDDCPVIMTSKDAVKCHAFAGEHVWALEVEAELPAALAHALQQHLDPQREQPRRQD